MRMRGNAAVTVCAKRANVPAASAQSLDFLHFHGGVDNFRLTKRERLDIISYSQDFPRRDAGWAKAAFVL